MTRRALLAIFFVVSMAVMLVDEANGFVVGSGGSLQASVVSPGTRGCLRVQHVFCGGGATHAGGGWAGWRCGRLSGDAGAVSARTVAAAAAVPGVCVGADVSCLIYSSVGR